MTWVSGLAYWLAHSRCSEALAPFFLPACEVPASQRGPGVHATCTPRLSASWGVERRGSIQTRRALRFQKPGCCPSHSFVCRAHFYEGLLGARHCSGERVMEARSAAWAKAQSARPRTQARAVRVHAACARRRRLWGRPCPRPGPQLGVGARAGGGAERLPAPLGFAN